MYWVRDSIAHVLLGDAEITEAEKYGHYLKYKSGENEGEVIEPKLINWREEIPWDSDNEEVQAALLSGLPGTRLRTVFQNWN